MAWRDMSKKKILLLILILLLVLGALILYFLVSHLPMASPPVQAPMATPLPGTGGANANANANKEATLSKVDVELARVIDVWCEAEETSYGAPTALQELWVRKNQISPPYNPRGIIELMSTIRKNELFSQCKAAKRIKRGHFMSGGAIQTVGELNEFLSSCDDGS